MKNIKLLMIGMIFLFAGGCTKQPAIQAEVPVLSVEETMQGYLDAFHQMDAYTMSKFTYSGMGENFQLDAEDLADIGLDTEQMKLFYQKLFDFSYTIDEQREEDEQIYVDVTFEIYDIAKLFDEVSKKEEDTFANINKEDITEEEKQKKIVDIFVDALQDAKHTKTIQYTFQLKQKNGSWKIVDDNLQDFYEMLLQI